MSWFISTGINAQPSYRAKKGDALPSDWGQTLSFKHLNITRSSQPHHRAFCQTRHVTYGGWEIELPLYKVKTIGRAYCMPKVRLGTTSCSVCGAALFWSDQYRLIKDVLLPEQEHARRLLKSWDDNQRLEVEARAKFNIPAPTVITRSPEQTLEEYHAVKAEYIKKQRQWLREEVLARIAALDELKDWSPEFDAHAPKAAFTRLAPLLSAKEISDIHLSMIVNTTGGSRSFFVEICMSIRQRFLMELESVSPHP